jgi:aspartate aminotransferase-like enzyme
VIGTFFHPGPTEVRPEILEALSRRMIPHRGTEMRDLLARVHPRLQSLFGTRRPVYVATCAATAMMEAGIRCGARRRVLALVSGAFGERFAQIAERCGREVSRLRTPAGAAVTAEQVSAALEHGEYDTVTAVQVETSTGVLTDIASIARLTREVPDTLLLVDGVSSVGGMEVAMDACGVDLLFSGSQKALALPPGLAFASCSDRLLERARSIPGRGMYLDLVRYDEFWQKGETSTTPAISLCFALDAQLEAIEQEGLQARFRRHAAMRATVERWVAHARARGLSVGLLAEEGVRAPTVSCLTYEGDARRIVAGVRERDVVIGGGYGELAQSTFRIGHMGDHTVEQVERALAMVEDVLAEQRRAVGADG